MASKRKTPPMPQPVSIEVNGKVYTGTYTVDAGMISVSSAMGIKKTQVGGSSPGNLAQLMLGELVREGKA